MSDKAYPKVDSKKCTGCGACVSICPMEVFVLDKKKAVVKKPKECIACHACESQCPVQAIKIIE